MTKLKMTLADLQEEQEAAKHNSDLSNLATALTQIKRHRRNLEQFVKQLNEELNNTEAQIKDIATKIESGEEADVREIRNVYDLAQRPKTKLPEFLA
jgi:predicted  nucleic acid-binding Zn-ribbon protein